ncbi:MAG: hypothetical protein WBP29_12720 [Candidatus Zixiibacteriota bacterium]
MTDPNSQPVTPAPDDAAPDPMLVQRYLQNVRDNQNLTMGIVGGAAGALIGAIIWAIIAAVAHMNIGFIAIAVGLLSGLGVRFLGKGIDIQFPIADGSIHRILKNFPSVVEINAALESKAIDIDVQELQHYWLASCHSK